jgi:hypothetical protein
MTGTVPHNEKRPQEPAPAREVHAAMPLRRAYGHLRRPLHAPPQRTATQLTHEPAANQPPVQDATPIEPVARSQEPTAQTMRAKVLQGLSRTGRLTFDALLLIVFAPVIAVWWLNEKRHKR